MTKKGWPLPKMARLHGQTHFGTFDFWIKPGFEGRKRLEVLKTLTLVIFSNIRPLARPNIAENLTASRLALASGGKTSDFLNPKH